MCLIFTCGEHTFRKEVEGYEGLVCRCYNCGNMSGSVVKTHPWFTFCFVPVVPLSIKGYEDVSCHICNFSQPLEHRPDVQAMRNGGNGMPLQPQGGIPPSGGYPPQASPPPGGYPPQASPPPGGHASPPPGVSPGWGPQGPAQTPPMRYA
ncbi:hypothetical protein B0H63DRAFT_25182 [Podospora didyma]|uniref:Rhodopsin family protein n=1 Tax=Podospora didyma TaxID=330526 RepID=A0AAE0P5H3_9PEZI|nr:hypothetical protein B0H63DRAFT_25182 [Podospora didyma]